MATSAVIQSITGLLPPLLGTLDRVEWVQRHLYPPLAPRLAEELAPHLDYICPMVYPSGYHVGIPGTRNPVANPYRVVYESVRLTRQRAAPANVRIRPWLQDFRDYAFDKRYFRAGEIRAQIQGTQKAGGTGWMLWNPKNDYTGSALAPQRSVAAR